MLTFSFIPSRVRSRSRLSPQPYPTCHSLSFQARLPHPDRRSNSLSTASSKRFHPPLPLSSPANDVPPSIRLWCRLPRAAVVRTRQRERIMFEQFREWRNCVLRGPGEAAAVSRPPFFKPPSRVMIAGQMWSLKRSSGAVIPFSFLHFRDNYSSLRVSISLCLFRGFPLTTAYQNYYSRSSGAFTLGDSHSSWR